MLPKPVVLSDLNTEARLAHACTISPADML
jgi:hypothetical protein